MLYSTVKKRPPATTQHGSVSYGKRPDFYHPTWHRKKKTPEGPSAIWPSHSRSQYNVQVCGGQMRENEKSDSLSVMKTDGTGVEKV